MFGVRPIGTVQKQAKRTLIVIDKEYPDSLLGLEQWSYAQILWGFERNDTPQQSAILWVHPRGDRDNPLMGVFACRAPARPTLIALSPCQVLSVEDNVIEVESIDALERLDPPARRILRAETDHRIGGQSWSLPSVRHPLDRRTIKR